jgi:hypothetical protein
MPQSFTSVPVVQIELQAKQALVRDAASVAPRPQSQSVQDAGLVLEQDMRRAAALLAQGELTQAVEIIEPHAKSWVPPLDDSDLSAELFDAREPVQQNAAQVPMFKLYADICWEMVVRDQQRENFARAARALRVFLSIKPDDMPTRLCLAHCLINLADREPDDIKQVALLQSCIDALQAVSCEDPVPELIRLGMLGEVRCRRALLNMSVDKVLLNDAEQTLREALARGATADSGVAWWLQTLLGTAIPGMAADVAVARLQESITLLRQGAATCTLPGARSRWQAALVCAEVEQIHRAQPSPALQRLQLRNLYDGYTRAMREESSPEVVAAWIGLLCAMVVPMAGTAALERYREIDDELGRLSELAPASRLYAKAWMQMVHGRLLIESDAGKRHLLAQAEAILAPHLEVADKALRLQASKLALEQASLALDAEAREAAYARSLELARPLTVMPSVALDALKCAIKASLALGDDNERRVYARCLRMMMDPKDGESLGLLAHSAHRDGDAVRTCQDLELAWQERDKAMPEALLDLWQLASREWSTHAGDDEACRQNRGHLRLADTRRGR